MNIACSHSVSFYQNRLATKLKLMYDKQPESYSLISSTHDQGWFKFNAYYSVRMGRHCGDHVILFSLY